MQLEAKSNQVLMARVLNFQCALDLDRENKLHFGRQ